MTGHINSSAKHENCNFLLQLVYITEHLGMLKLPERLCNFFYLPVWLPDFCYWAMIMAAGSYIQY